MPHEEVDERAHFGREMPARGIDRVDHAGRGLKFRQQRLQRPRSQAGPSHETWRARDAKAGFGGRETGFRVGKSQPSADRLGERAAVGTTEAPIERIAKIRIDDAFAAHESLGPQRLAAAREVVRRGHDDDAIVGELAGDQAAVAMGADADRKIEALVDEVDDAVGEADVELDLGIVSRESDEGGRQLRRPERNGNRNAKRPAAAPEASRTEASRAANSSSSGLTRS